LLIELTAACKFSAQELMLSVGAASKQIASDYQNESLKWQHFNRLRLAQR